MIKVSHFVDLTDILDSSIQNHVTLPIQKICDVFDMSFLEEKMTF